MKIKIFTLIIIGSITVLPSLKAQLIGWSLSEVIKLKGNNYELGTTTIKYEDEKSLVNGKEAKVGYSEIYHFDSITNLVYKFIGIGLKRESEIIEIIEKNNSKYQKVVLRERANFYQWVDLKNSIEITLSIMMQYGDNKFILYSSEKKD